jgi:hypothetical protein
LLLMVKFGKWSILKLEQEVICLLTVHVNRLADFIFSKNILLACII